jgi:hypothetical protein
MSSVNIWLRTAAVERMYPTSSRAPLGVLGTLAGRLKPCELVTVSPGDTDPTPPEMSADIPTLQVPECGREVNLRWRTQSRRRPSHFLSRRAPAGASKTIRCWECPDAQLAVDATTTDMHREDMEAEGGRYRPIDYVNHDKCQHRAVGSRIAPVRLRTDVRHGHS